MQPGVFFDEVRSWRYPATYAALVGTILLGSIAGWLLGHDIVDEHASWGAWVFIGGLFGAGFLLLFGTCAVVLFLRILQPPCRIRIDTAGFYVKNSRAEVNRWTPIYDRMVEQSKDPMRSNRSLVRRLKHFRLQPRNLANRVSDA